MKKTWSPKQKQGYHADSEQATWVPQIMNPHRQLRYAVESMHIWEQRWICYQNQVYGNQYAIGATPDNEGRTKEVGGLITAPEAASDSFRERPYKNTQ